MRLLRFLKNDALAFFQRYKTILFGPAILLAFISTMLAVTQWLMLPVFIKAMGGGIWGGLRAVIVALVFTSIAALSIVASKRLYKYWLLFWNGTDPEIERLSQELRQKFYARRKDRENLSVARSRGIQALRLGAGSMTILGFGLLIYVLIVTIVGLFSPKTTVSLFSDHIIFQGDSAIITILLLIGFLKALIHLFSAIFITVAHYLATEPR